MPKILNNLEERIYKKAGKLFCEFGYDIVDMRAIARECDIAVGTLYNYYSSKKDLYLKIVRNSWDKTFFKLSKIVNEEKKLEEKVCNFIIVLYDDMSDRRGIGIDIRKAEGKKENKIADFEKNLLDELTNLINKLFKGQEMSDCNVCEKLAYTLLFQTIIFENFFKEERKNNIEFLYKTVMTFIAV
ncbi:TetR/AcrR family transcriptional regulator [Hathewaya limosa]|uniref:AcrR family transcriptional regulator n=1 Tax=Hathewaya limosa TaxID=1536 RepID=A0ABU0JNQ7_HATLI|nr:TetR/AcrR family transcriptional regulator [Hathewaya limosa]MDQ0478713.1 AcrR family transcriptional regulator [Hathewaya limosa]